MTGVVRIAIVLALAAAATIVANVILLGVASGPQDPVGRLAPPAALSAPATVPGPHAPQLLVPATRGHEQEHRDD